MVRVTFTKGVLVSVFVLETVYICQNLSTHTHCSQDGVSHNMKHAHEHTEGPRLYIVTPTYRRSTQVADMTRLANTLRHLSNTHWIVIEDAQEIGHVVNELLKRSGLPFTQLAATVPPEHNATRLMGRGVFNRREGLRWLRANAKEGVLYFADDDNAYDLRLFEQIRWTQRVSVFPVGMILNLGLSSPIVRQGQVVGFHDGFQGGRKFAVDMAGFAVNLAILLENPAATIPMRVSYLEDGFLRQLKLELDDLEPLADQCTQVLVWHTKTQRPATPNIKHIGQDYYDTNLVDLYQNVLR